MPLEQMQRGIQAGTGQWGHQSFCATHWTFRAALMDMSMGTTLHPERRVTVQAACLPLPAPCFLL